MLIVAFAYEFHVIEELKDELQAHTNNFFKLKDAFNAFKNKNSIPLLELANQKTSVNVKTNLDEKRRKPKPKTTADTPNMVAQDKLHNTRRRRRSKPAVS